MNIRLAQSKDTEFICHLLKQMGYSQPLRLIEEQFQRLSKDSNAITLVAADDLNVYGVLSLYFIPQIALKGTLPKYVICVLTRICVVKEWGICLYKKQNGWQGNVVVTGWNCTQDCKGL